MNNLIGIAVLITVLYNLTILIYCIKEGFKDLCNKNISHKKAHNKPMKIPKFSICLNTSEDVFYLYTGKEWINERDISIYFDIISKCKQTNNLLCEFKINEEEKKTINLKNNKENKIDNILFDLNIILENHRNKEILTCS